MKIHKLTFVLLILVIGTMGLTFATRNQTPVGKPGAADALKQHQEKKGRFPTADYEEPELTDPKKNQARKEKNLRHNGFRMVARNPPEWQAELLVTGDGGVQIPALPVAESSFIVLGEVTAAEAHVSENKKNVYSEFTVSISRVFKRVNDSINEGTSITVDRRGGFVKYPNGRAVLYRLSGINMPAVGSRYLFFLTSPNSHDLLILTAYALDGTGVTPLDDSPHFAKFSGVAEDVFLQNVLDSLVKSSPY